MAEEQRLVALIAQRPRPSWKTIARQVGRSRQACISAAKRLRLQRRLPPDGSTAHLAVASPQQPLPGSRLEALLLHLRELAQLGRPLEHIDHLPDVIGAASASGVSRLFRELEQRGLVRVTTTYRGIEAVAAADGSWTVAGYAKPAAPGLQRRCLTCKLPFEAEHRLNFVCAGCKASDLWRWGDAA